MNIAIYIPGLGYELGDISMAAYVKRFAKALDKNDENKLHQYAVEFEKKIFDNNDHTEYEVGKISRKLIGSKDTPEIVYKFYEFKFEDDFVRDYSDGNIFTKSFRLFWGVFKMMPVFLLTLFKGNGLRKAQKFQSLYFFMILILLSLFGILVLPSLITILLDNTTIKHNFTDLTFSFWGLNFDFKSWAVCFRNFSNW